MGSSNKMEQDLYVAEAKGLISRAASAYDSRYGLSTTSIQMYDTAWVAMITKTIDNQKRWLFEGSFHYLLRTQSNDGSWGRNPVSQTAALLDTAAALLALAKHAREPLQIVGVSSLELRKRIDKATKSLNDQILAWHDMDATNHIGAEMIVPALLDYLEEEGVVLIADYPAKKEIQRMKAEKMSTFDPSKLYGHKPSSVLHSLEAFIGKIDFDKISHHLFQGSMLASPSSTAAYLMNVSKWDDEAENHLRHVFDQGSGHGDGGIPGTFPTTYFEYSWVLCTLVQNGFDKHHLQSPELDAIVSVLKQGFHDDGGVIGFAPRAIDVDDTAKGLLALSVLHQTEGVNVDAMIKIFESQDHFRTFASEKDPSLTSNCHVLLALMHSPDPIRYRSQIVKTIRFVCQYWWDSDGFVKDKWHLSRLYPTMLVVEALTEVIQLIEEGSFRDILTLDMQWRICICLFQACHRTLLEQQTDGSWDQMPEQTAYAILTLSTARQLSFLQDLGGPVETAIAQGVAYLKDNDLDNIDQNWTSKTAYRVELVASAYHLAALQAQYFRKGNDYSIGTTFAVDSLDAKSAGFLKIVGKTPLLSKGPEWQVRASMLESLLFVPLLRAQRSQVFERDEDRIEKDDYLDIIPFTWINCSNAKRTFVSTWLLYEMMVISMLGYQIDEFIESIVDPAFDQNPAGVHLLIDEVVAEVIESGYPKLNGESNGASAKVSAEAPLERNGMTNGHCQTNGTKRPRSPGEQEEDDQKAVKLAKKGSSDRLSKIRETLSRFCNHILRHPNVLTSSAWDQSNLQRELKSFLHAHATQSEDNRQFRLQSEHKSSDLSFSNPGRAFFAWVRSTAADHVACAYSFAFTSCLISSKIASGAEMFSTAGEKYLAAATVRHLTTACRMYNDFGSVARDEAEVNLNSVHFPEFTQPSAVESCILDSKKEALLKLARYEDQCVKQTLATLRREVEQASSVGHSDPFARRKMDLVSFFCDVTDTYDQLYVVRDFSSRMKQSE